MPLSTTALVTGALPLVPLMGVGPVAVSVKLARVAEPLLLLVSDLTRVSCGLRVLVRVQVMACARPLAEAPVRLWGMVTVGADAVPPTVTAVPAAFTQDEVVA